MKGSTLKTSQLKYRVVYRYRPTTSTTTMIENCLKTAYIRGIYERKVTKQETDNRSGEK